MKQRLASILNASVENVDVFTVLHSPHNPNTTQLDVRFSAHGSPYYQPERINAAIVKHQSEVIKIIKLNYFFVIIYFYNIDFFYFNNIARERIGSCIPYGQY